MSNITYANSTRLTKSHTKDLLAIANLCDKLSIVLAQDKPMSADEKAVTSIALFAAVEMITSIAAQGCGCDECENERDSASS